jgi:hypothetical protein
MCGPAKFVGFSSVHHHGSLHLGLPGCTIMVFNIAAETFWSMGHPFQLSFHELLKMDGTLALCSVSRDQMAIDVWVIEDYDDEMETWTFKHQINLSGFAPIPCSKVMWFPRMVVLNDGELLIHLARGRGRVFHCDINGKFLGYLKSMDDQEISMQITKHYLQ